MMFRPGDVVAAYSPLASKRKFHLCVIDGSDNAAARFLFLNSEPKHPSDLVLPDGTIAGLPMSRTGRTVVSFTLIVRFTSHQLDLYRASKISTASPDVIDALCRHTRTVATLNRLEKRQILAAFGQSLS